MEDVGDRIHKIREEKGLTIKDVSLMSGTAVSLISQIENNKANPSLSTLRAIAKALGVDVSRFFCVQEGDRINEGNLVVRSSERIIYKKNAMVTYYLLANSDEDHMEFGCRVYEPGFTTEDYPELHPADVHGKEFGMVIQGKLQVIVDGEIYILNQYDSIFFDASLPHSVKNINKTPTEVFWFNYHI